MHLTTIVITMLSFIVLLLLAAPAGAFEIITAEDITENIITQEMLVRAQDRNPNVCLNST